MKHAILSTMALILTVALPVEALAQQVYRCQLADGSTVFSDLPCQSDIGVMEMVDATHHQGHRPASNAGEPAYRLSRDREAGPRPGRARHSSPPKGDTLSRVERLSLERERKKLLSGLKRRHVDPGERRRMIGELREVDSQLGIGPEDVAGMPFHNREVYEDNPVYPGELDGSFSTNGWGG